MTRVLSVVGTARTGGTEHFVASLTRGLDRSRFLPAIAVVDQPGPMSEAYQSAAQATWHLHWGAHGLPRVLRAWHALDRRYRRLGLGREPHESALDWAERVRQARPSDDGTLLGLSQRFSDWRYAASQPGAAQARRSLIRELRAHRPH